MTSLLKASTLAAILGGCFASGSVGYHAAVVAPAPAVVVETQPAPPPPPPPQPEPVVEVAYVEPASYVYVTPEVQVIEDYDYPVFFYGGVYWRQDGGVWYSSSYHDRGWVTASAPMQIRSIQRPEVYAHYHADVHARVGQPGYRAPVRPVVQHQGPPPKFIDHPGHGPVVHPMPPTPVGPRPEPVHTAQPAPMPMQPAHPAPAPMPMQPAHPAPAPMPMQPAHQGPAPMPMQPAHTPPPAAAPSHESHNAAAGPSMHATPPPHPAPPARPTQTKKK